MRVKINPLVLSLGGAFDALLDLPQRLVVKFARMLKMNVFLQMRTKQMTKGIGMSTGTQMTYSIVDFLVLLYSLARATLLHQ
jgi:hypothetical protein